MRGEGSLSGWMAGAACRDFIVLNPRSLVFS